MYNAWFAPSIPVPFGPYKLGVLPGLILSAISNDGKVFWKFKSIKSDINEDVFIAPPSSGRLMEWGVFEQFWFDRFQIEIQAGRKLFEIKKDELIVKERYRLYTKFKQKGYKTPNERKKLRKR
ncbi:MAG: GLPGLI family protein [Chitinophagales bacterium]|nr:GLPGLI family protein [Chitinophagales bacterium]